MDSDPLMVGLLGGFRWDVTCVDYPWYMLCGLVSNAMTHHTSAKAQAQPLLKVPRNLAWLGGRDPLPPDYGVKCLPRWLSAAGEGLLCSFSLRRKIQPAVFASPSPSLIPSWGKTQGTHQTSQGRTTHLQQLRGRGKEKRKKEIKSSN